jgi:two-component system response regulator AtoC
MTSKQILIVDDEPRMQRVLEIMLHKLGHRVLKASNGREALGVFAAQRVDLVVTDLLMPELDGIGLLTQLHTQAPEVPVIVITAHGTIETAVAAMRNGAFDYVVRPFDIDVLELTIERALKEAAVARQNAFLRQEIDRGWGDFVGKSAAMRAIYDLIGRVGPTKASVLIHGETGTGKELAARALHNASPRRDKLFVPVNCAAIPSEMLESELFGYEKGAFTGAIKDRVGKFELADGGTIFLDELTEMPVALQAKLLRVLQENVVERLGSNRPVTLDIRVIAATNRPPEEAVKVGSLRADLYYRLNVFSIHMPPLRERPEDIPPLVDLFIARGGGRASESGISAPARERLMRYAWPGNVRELQNMIERALILAGGRQIDESHFSLPTRNAPASRERPGDPRDLQPLQAAVSQLESRLIDSALEQAQGNKARAAALLDISERTLWYKLKKLRPGEEVE